jgi:hypothetical protein
VTSEVGILAYQLADRRRQLYNIGCQLAGIVPENRMTQFRWVWRWFRQFPSRMKGRVQQFYARIWSRRESSDAVPVISEMGSEAPRLDLVIAQESSDAV